jgi:hypothetical protein
LHGDSAQFSLWIALIKQINNGIVEGNHHTVKTYIRLGNMDFLTVLKRIDQLLANQIVELNKEIEREKIIISHHHRIDCFQDLHYKVSQFALDKLLEQFNYAVGGHEDSPTCAGMFTDTYGLPCKHEITNYAAPPSATTCWGTARDPGPFPSATSLAFILSNSPDTKYFITTNIWDFKILVPAFILARRLSTPLDP